MNTYYYPDNLAAKPVILKYWSVIDILIIGALIMASLFLLMSLQVWYTIIFAVVYGFMSMKLSGGYSITKLILLYLRYLFTDELILKWR